VTQTPKVLVIEDDETIRESLIDFLADNGYEALGAVNGRDALEKLRATRPPCLIVLDLMMPIMDGEKFREQQLQDPTLSHIPTVVMSAYRDVAGMAAAVTAHAYLTKPFKLDELLEVVQTHCLEACSAARD
jgi:CheY-like chemotaxis protein